MKYRSSQHIAVWQPADWEAAWLASAENSYSTGGIFDLSGGRATY